MKITVTMEFEGADAMERAVKFFAQPPVAILEPAVSHEEPMPRESTTKKRGKTFKEVPAKEVIAAGKVLTDADAQAAIEKLFEKKGLEVSRQVLSRFGVQKLKDLKPEKYAEFIDLAEKVIAGAEV